MKGNWETLKLRDVCEFDKSPSIGANLPYVGLEHIESDTGAFLGSRTPQTVKSLTFRFSSEHVLYGRLRPYLNKVLLPEFEGHCSTEIFPIKPKGHLCKRFLFHWLMADATVRKIDATSTGARMPRANMNAFLDFDIAVPPLPEQMRIVAILDEAFSGIARAKEIAEKNLANAREIFDSFLETAFTSDSIEWEEKRLGDTALLEIIDGDRGKNYPTKDEFHENGHCLFMNTKNVRPDGFDFQTRMYITAEKDKQLGNGKLERDDVVMTTRGTIGNLGLYSEDVKHANIRINSGMLIFRPNTKILLPEYLFEVLRSGIMKRQIMRDVSGAAQPQLPIRTLVSFRFPLPKSLATQSTIVSKLRTLLVHCKEVQSIYVNKIRLAEQLKKSLLHQAFTGSLTKGTPS